MVKSDPKTLPDNWSIRSIETRKEEIKQDDDTGVTKILRGNWLTKGRSVSKLLKDDWKINYLKFIQTDSKFEEVLKE